MPQTLWYIRSGDRSSGPFPTGQIIQFLELGRLRPNDLVSLDGHAWMSVQECGRFEATLRSLEEAAARTPATGQGPEDWARERALARKRWLDERDQSGPAPAESGEARSAEAQIITALRQDHAHTEELTREVLTRRPSYRIGLVALVVLVAIALAVWFGQMHQPEPAAARLTTLADCTAPAGPEVGWQGCDKRQARLAGVDLKGARLERIRLDGADLQRADLSYANLRGASLRGVDLSGARLVGADLAGADLSGANLSEANLEYATLTGANLEGVRLYGTRLGKAAWTDGRLCAPQSLDSCG